MATVTIGTTANNTLTGVLFAPSLASIPAGNQIGAAAYIPNIADFGTIDSGILDDINPTHPIFGPSNGLTPQGLLYVPNRGVLRCRPGDYVAFDPQTGWPILVSGRAAANAGWVHT